ncbi:carnitine--CoA ligase [Aliibacillus thermotolerans]|nr:carnitine--CoA ligase [Aliibacillus thermotolerans]
MMEMSVKGDCCIVCEKVKKEGIYVLHSFICLQCEQEIVQLEPEDPAYRETVKKLRKLNMSGLLSK